MNAEFKVAGLFPTPIAIVELSRDYQTEELRFIDELRRKTNVGNEISVNGYILDEPVMQGLKNELQAHVDRYYAEVHAPAAGSRLVITQSWSNYTRKGMFHHLHTHRNSFVSGVLYVKTNLGSDQIRFVRPKVNHFGFEPTKWNIYNAESTVLDAVEKSLFLFPSDLPHEVLRMEGDEERISISFNTYVIGSLGSYSEKTELKIGETK
jgi:uncharacterized protein (TIGR02466 family)